MPSLSVVIPTYRRAKILAKTLDCLAAQTIAKDIEVIVVSDGPDVEAEETIRRFTSRHPSPVTRYLSIPKSQQGAARNAGVRMATGDRVLFIGDDIFLEKDACAYHANSGEWRAASGENSRNPSFDSTQDRQPVTRNPSAVLGFTTWDPDLIITPVMKWLEESGWQFGYPKIAEYAGKALPPEIQHKFTYTSHVSVPLKVARSIPFRQNLTMYGWEDIEWGLRLKDAGVPLIYEPRAKALHHHALMLEQSLARMETLGKSAVMFESLEPRLNIVPKGFKLFVREIESLLPTMAGKHKKAFLRGIKTTI